jgi:hypothetical protein
MSQRDQQPAKILVVHTVDNVPVPQGARRGRTTVEAAEVGGLTEDRSGISYKLDAKRIVRIPWANIRAIEVEAK